MTTKSWHFVHLSDPQFGMFRPGADDYDETPLVARAVARVNALKPAFVLCTGDLIDVPCSDRQMDHAKSMLAELSPDIPFLAVPGNHDVGDAPTDDHLAWYRAMVGRDRFSFNHRGWHFTGINSCLLADDEHVPQEALAQWAWLEEDLARLASTGAVGRISFLHHPPFMAEAEEPEDYFNLPRTPRARLLGMLRRYDVGTLLCGHLHRSHEAGADGLRVLVAGPVGMPLQDGFSGLRLVKVDGPRLEHRFFALDDAEGQEAFLAGRAG